MKQPDERKIYLDHNATTPLLPEVLARMGATFQAVFGNPSSIHSAGIAAEGALEEARRGVARDLGVQPGEIVFTSGGTEANNLAVLGIARALSKRGRHVVVSAAEHPSVQKAALALVPEGFDVCTAPVDARGILDLERLRALLRPDTVLVACALASSETGAIQPVRALGALMRECAPVACLHVDAVQAFGKVPVDPRALGCHTISMSAHKVGGPKGAGFLYIRPRTPIRPILHGGGQERGLRSGTQNVPGIVGLASALRLALAGRAEHASRWTALREQLVAGLDRVTSAAGVSVRWNTPFDEAVANTLSVSFPGVRGEVLVRALEDHGVICSTGPACHEGKAARVSPLLEAMGLTKPEQEGAVRISLGTDTTSLDIDTAITSFAQALTRLSWTIRRQRATPARVRLTP